MIESQQNNITPQRADRSRADSAALLGANSPLQRMAEQLQQHSSVPDRWEVVADILEDNGEEVQIALKKSFDTLLLRMKQLQASDLDLGGPGCQERIWFRTHGVKQQDRDLGNYSVDKTDLLIFNLLTVSDRQHLLKHKYVDFSYRVYDEQGEIWTRFRATVYFDLNHLALNMRRVNDRVISFSKLGLHKEVAKTLSLKYQKSGLILVTGITGSGKSTTLDSIIDANNRTMEAHIVIIADPIEYVHKPIKSIVKHREIGRDVASFKEGTIQALRQDPDIIMIGEMRNAETMLTVLEVVDSGHKVFSTLHTSSAIESIDRILGEVPADEQDRVRTRLADVLSCVISQKLVPSENGQRILAKEVMVTTPAIQAAIRNNNLGEIYQIVHQSSDKGMITLEQDLARLYSDNKISYFEAYINANNKRRFEELVKHDY